VIVIAYTQADISALAENDLKLYRLVGTRWTEATCPGYPIHRFPDQDLIAVPICQTGIFGFSDVAPGPIVGKSTLYLPLVLRAPSSPPSSEVDLVVAGLTLDPPAPVAGQAVTVQVTLRNQGSARAGCFWADLYVNPDPVPSHGNQTWDEVCTEPCIGIAWYVPALGAGESATLTSLGGYVQECSDWPGWLPAGTHDLYAYVDVYDPEDDGCTVAESDESNNRTGPLRVVVSGSGP
jgi:hypothetical protein